MQYWVYKLGVFNYEQDLVKQILVPKKSNCQAH
jgi:hypothetical protein